MGDPLQCAVCKAPATVHLTQIAHGKINKVHLCEHCAAKGGATEAPVFNLGELLADVKGASGEPASHIPVGHSCPECGLTEADFKKNARFGCARCYELFSDTLQALLPRIQRGVSHGGKHPAGARIHAARAELTRRREELKAAVKTEDYVAAARARDAVKALEVEIAGLERQA